MQVSANRRIVLLIDTSASMRRNGIWDNVISQAKSVLDDVGRDDRLCVMSYDQSVKTLIGFEQWAALDLTRRASIITEQITKLSPGWSLTNLDNALISAAEAIEDDQINDDQRINTTSQVILISDLQKGTNLNELSAYEWPEQTQLLIKSIQCQSNTNAALQLITDRRKSGGDDNSYHVVRIINSSNATKEQFQISWADEQASSSNPKKDVYVPAGHSVVVHVPTQANQTKSRKLILTGDDHDFDNTLYLAPFLQQQVNILYIGSDNPADSKEMLFYLQRAFGTTRELKPNIISHPGNVNIPSNDIETAHLIIVADTINRENLDSLRQYLKSDHTLLLVMKSADDVATLMGLSTVENIESEEANVDRYAMLSRIEFNHPLLTPFSKPSYRDFTQIHFWKYRQINCEDWPNAQILAQFDSGFPALIELPLDKGSLLILTSSWRSTDSQLALSSKFVPLLYSILEYSGVLAGQQSQYFVDDDITIPHSIKTGSANLQIRKPDNSLINLDSSREFFTQTDMPGIYTIETSAGDHHFAVNLSPRECQTATMQIENIERFGVTFKQSSGITTQRDTQSKPHISYAGMESKQKVWRWVLVVLLVVSLIEICLAGWLTRSPTNMQGEKND